MKNYSESSFSDKDDKATLIRLLAHAIEKGMTLPNCRAGFGKEKVKQLIELCEDYSGNDMQSVDTAYGVLSAYVNWQESNSGDTRFISKEIREKIFNRQLEGGTMTLSSTPIFGFEEIARHRHSLRNFSSEPVSLDDIYEAVRLAQTAPSACNRQSIRIYAVTDLEKIYKIMQLHGGIRSMVSPSVIFIVAGDRTLYRGEYERNTVFVDGGIFTMNLLYALDNYGIASCPAIWGNIPSDDEFIHKLIDIPTSQIIINLIVAGYYPDVPYKVAVSAKRDTKTILKII